MFRQVGVPVLGIVENMSYLTSDRGESIPVFGSGGGERLAIELQAPLLGKVPLDPRICTQGDLGKPMAIAYPDTLAARIFSQIASALNATFLRENT
jgi:ATP-binding protein involved in chromosome partitioning